MMHRRMLRGVVAIAAAASLMAGCGDEAGTDPTVVDDGQGGKEDSDRGEQSLCVGVRGNGPLIFAHFASMARIHEHYGLIDGVAGGSSGSITSFLTESIYANPHVFQCADGACDEAESAARVALLFKSIEGYLAVLGNTDEALAFQQLAPIAARVQAEGVGELIENGDFEAAREALLTVLESEDIKDLIEPEIIDLLTNSPDPAFHVQDIHGSLASFGSFSAEDDKILLRPGVISFAALAEKLGRIASFYAAYGPSDAAAWDAFMAGCATKGKGMSFRQLQAVDAGDGLTCGEHFGALLTTWRTAFIADEGNYPSRADDEVGKFLPALISTSVLEGDAVAEWEAAREGYLTAKDYSFDVNFDDVRFGYWGQPSDVARVESNPNGYKDAKTGKFLNLGGATYRTALAFSPAEPGLTRAQEIDDQIVSAGGWSDLAPVMILKNMGCDKVILVTRQDDVQGFGPDVARLLGMTPDQNDALYGLTNPDSGIHTSLTEADGVWCTNWNKVDSFNFPAAFDDAFDAPFETTDALFTGADAYGNLSEKLGLPGCTAGTAP